MHNLFRALRISFYATRLFHMLGMARLFKRAGDYLAHHRLVMFWAVAVLSFTVPWGLVLFTSDGHDSDAKVFPGIPAPAQHSHSVGIPAYDGEGLRVTFIDVGQGDAALVRQGECSVLVDGGRDRTEVRDVLRGKGLGGLDLMIATHAHADHVGGLTSILYGMDVTKVWYNGQDYDTQTASRFRQAKRSEAAMYRAPLRGEEWSCGEMTVEVLHPAVPAHGYTGHLHDKNIMVRVVYGEFKSLITGDIERRGELDILDSGMEVNAQILELGHHGSRTSSHPDWVRAVGPELAVWQAGEGNRYGHPHDEVLESLSILDIPAIGTADHGTVVILGEQDGDFQVFSSR